MTIYNPDEYAGPLQIKAEAGSAICRRLSRRSGAWKNVPAANFIGDISDWMKRHRPQCRLVRFEGARFYYAQTQ